LYDYDSLVNDYKVKGCIFNINQYSNLDSESVKEICYFVSHGNSAFLSARAPDELLDSLHVEMDADFKYSDSIFNWVANPKLGSNKYNILEGVGNNYFAKIDSTNTTVLATKVATVHA
jgi:hypothetical protein